MVGLFVASVAATTTVAFNHRRSAALELESRQLANLEMERKRHAAFMTFVSKTCGQYPKDSPRYSICVLDVAMAG